MFVTTKGLPQIITSMLKKTPSHLRSNTSAGFVKFMIKIEPLSAKVCLDHREGRFKWAKIR